MHKKSWSRSRFAAFVVLLLAFVLVGCGSSAKPTPKSTFESNTPASYGPSDSDSTTTETEVPEPVVTQESDPLSETPNLPYIDPNENLAKGAVPPKSQVTSDNYGYTVKSYLEWIVADLDTRWTPWFVANGFAEPQLTYDVVTSGERWVSTCNDPATKKPMIITDTTPNAYYCPTDEGNVGTIWLPATTFQKMWTGDIFTRQSQQAGDFGAAIITAHEFGHHVADEIASQSLTRGTRLPAITGKNNELIADCFAGVWASAAYYDGILEGTDFEEAVAALYAIGDAAPSEDPHGSPAERAAALKLGYNDQREPGYCINTYWK